VAEGHDPVAAAEEVRVEDLTKVFGRRTVLDRVSFTIPGGGFLALFGPNGAGKTTLVRILTGLLAPTEGKVLIGGRDMTGDPIAIRQTIGLISHNPLLYPELTAEENLRFYATLYGVPDAGARIDEMLEKVELSHRRYDRVRTFSRGMLQRVAIARALLHRPTVVFLDEPHTGLDPHAVDILDGLLESVREDHTFVMITHSLEKGLSLATQAMVLVGGKISFYQDLADIDLDALKAIYEEQVALGVAL
jgi:heme exporter protein A